MHLEGKLHTGYLKIRKILAELKQKREESRRLKDRERKDGKRRSRSRSNSPMGPPGSSLPSRGGNNNQRSYHNHQSQKPDSRIVDDSFYFSSKRYGSGIGVPDDNHVKYSELAMNENNQMGTIVQMTKAETLGKEWGYYKRNIDKNRKEMQKI